MTIQDSIFGGVEKKVYDLLLQCRGSRRLVLLIVAIGLLLDNMLLTSVGMNSFYLIIVFYMNKKVIFFLVLRHFK
jgi:predicted Kef-type K+ transport protein